MGRDDSLRRCAMTSFDESKDVSFGDSAAFTRSWDLIDVDALFFGEVPHRWSRQGFSSAITKMLFTWGSSGHFISHLVLNGHSGLRLGGCRGRCWCCCLCRFCFFFAAFFLNSHHHMSNWNNIVIAKVDGANDSSRCGRNLCDKFVGEDFAKVLILFNFIANLDIPLFERGLLRALAQIGQFHENLRKVAAH